MTYYLNLFGQKIILKVFFIFLFTNQAFDVEAQIIKLNYTKIDSIKSTYSEFTTNYKIYNNQLPERLNIYDFGFNVNLIGYKPSELITLGLNSFFDVHVLDNLGYEKIGVRFLLEFEVIENITINLSPGIVLASSRKLNGFSSENHHQKGFSNEISVMFNRNIGITGRIDTSITREQNREIDYGVGIKVKGKLGTTIVGIIGILVAGMYNAILASQ